MASLTVKGFIDEFFKGKIVEESEVKLLESILSGKVKGFNKEAESDFIADLNEMVNASPESFYSNGEIRIDKFNSETEKIRIDVSEARESEVGVNAATPVEEVVQEEPINIEELQKIEEMKFRESVGDFLDKVIPNLPDDIKKYLENEAVQGRVGIEKQEELERNGVPPEKAEEIAGTAAGFDMSTNSGRAMYNRAKAIADGVEIDRIKNEKGMTTEQAIEQYVKDNPSRRSRVMRIGKAIKDLNEAIKDWNEGVREAFAVEQISLETDVVNSVLESSSIKKTVSKILKLENKNESLLKEEELKVNFGLTPEERENRKKDRLNAIDEIVNNYFTTGKSVYELYLELKKDSNPFNIGYDTIINKINERVQSENRKNDTYFKNDYIVNEEYLKKCYITLDLLQFELENAYSEGNKEKIAKIEEDILVQQGNIKTVKSNVNSGKKDFCKVALGKEVNLTEETGTKGVNVIDSLFEKCKDDEKVKEYMANRIKKGYSKMSEYAVTWVNTSVIRQTAIRLVKDKEKYKQLYGDVDKNRKNETLERIAKSYFSNEDSKKSIYDYWKELDKANNPDNISFSDILVCIKKNISDKVTSNDLKKWEEMEKKNYFDSLEMDALNNVYTEASYRGNDNAIRNREKNKSYATFGMTHSEERYEDRLFKLRNDARNYSGILASMKKTIIMGIDSAEKSNTEMQQENPINQPKINKTGLQAEEIVTNAPVKPRGKFKMFSFINRAIKRRDAKADMIDWDDCNAVIQEFGAQRDGVRSVGDAETPLKKGIQGNQMDQSGTR